MKLKYLFVLGLVLLISSIAVVQAVPWWKITTCPIKEDTNIVFYGENGFGGVGDLSESWITHFLNWWESYDSSINYVELSSEAVKTNCDLESFSNLKVYIQPGGNAYYQQRELGSEGRVNILSFINSGKAYLGICAGFYYAANDYYWQGDYYNHPDMLDIFPTVEGSITDIADYEGNPDHALTSLSNGFNAIYYGGPTRGWRDTPLSHPGEKVASFSDIPGDLPAIIKDNNLLLTSVHLEAFENEGITGLNTEDRVENYKLLANLINEAAGTSFYVPAYTNPPVCGNNIKEFGEVCDASDLGGESCISQGFDDGELSCLADCSFDTSACIDYLPQCNDGLDNDGDSLIDYPVDLGCDSLEDDDETDYTGPVELLFDGFEDGNLAEWTLSGTGRPWGVSTDTAYEGIWAAKATYTGAGEDSFMEIGVDASSFSIVTLEYYRKLVGLDAADDFEVSYFDGSWHSIEHLGDGRENNDAFIFKSFIIPNTATKIRFKCECGAVSEMCYVDNVKVIVE